MVTRHTRIVDRAVGRLSAYRASAGLVQETLFDQGLLVELNWKMPFGNGPVGISYRGPDSLSPAGTEFLKALRSTAKARGTPPTRYP